MSYASFQNKSISIFQIRRRSYDYYDRDYDSYDRRNDYYDDRDSYYQSHRSGGSKAQNPEPEKKKKSHSAAFAILGTIFRILFLFFVVVVLLLPQVMPNTPPFDRFKPISDKFIEYLNAGLFKYQEIPDRAEFTVDRIYTIESDGPLDYVLFVPIADSLKIDGEYAQELKEVTFTPQYTNISDNNEHWQWYNSISNSDGGQRTVKIRYHFKTSKIVWDISIDKSGTIDDIPKSAIKRWGGDQWPVTDDLNDKDDVDTDYDGYPDKEDNDDDDDGVLDSVDVDYNNDGRVDKYRIEPSNRQIQDTLLQILRDENLYSGSDLSNLGNLNVYRVVKAIYDYIDERCLYPDPNIVTADELNYDGNTYGGYPKWATGTLDPDYGRPRGDCDDQSILFISLCRAAGIPAMLQIGALYDVNRDHWEGHGWANVYMPYKQSYAEKKGVDHVTPMVDIVNDKFKTRDPNRFSEWVDNGVKGQINPNTGEWEKSDLEMRYKAIEYTRKGNTKSVNFNDDFFTINYKAYPPDTKIYI
jgi:hypothetical protein